jgi:polysaccharide pyruvyl transferase WcaK-like protein
MADKLLTAFLQSAQAEETIYSQLESLIQKRAQRYHQKTTRRKKFTKTLKLLFVGYAGAGNIGSDVRTIEMIRHIQFLLGTNVKISLMIISKKYAGNIFNGVKTLHPDYTPTFLYREIVKHHGVIVCEGSLFKSNFSPVLTWNMLAAMGLALVENKLAIAYGAEAGWMDIKTQQFAQRHCQESLILCRNQQSVRKLEPLALRTAAGADPAWTFEPNTTVDTKAMLRAAGWDGKQKLIAICPINPFWWPVRPDPLRAKQLTNPIDEQYHQSVFFHQQSPTITKKYQHYLQSLATVIQTLRREQKLFPFIIGMERLDRSACEHLAALVDFPPPIYVSDEWDIHVIVSLLRCSSYLLSSRFHAIVTALPARVIPIGIAMDERIENLLMELGHPELKIAADDDLLAEKILQLFVNLPTEKIASATVKMTARQLQQMGQMGITFREEVKRVFPEFSLPTLPTHWREHLPALSLNLQQILTVYAQ